MLRVAVVGFVIINDDAASPRKAVHIWEELYIDSQHDYDLVMTIDIAATRYDFNGWLDIQGSGYYSALTFDT